MRILYLNPSAEMGGAETSLVELFACIRQARPQWELSLLLGSDGPLAAKAEALGVSVRVMPMPQAVARLGDSDGRSLLAKVPSLLAAGFSAAVYARRLSQAIATVKPDLLHTTGFKMHLLGAWTCPREVPLIWHLHDYLSSRPLMKRLVSLFAARGQLVLVNSRSVAADVLSVLEKKAAKVQPVYNAVDLKRFAPEGTRVDLDSLSGLPPADPGTLRVGLVATFAHWKGHGTFLQALAQVPAGLNVRGYIIGGELYQTAGSQVKLADLRAEAERLGLIRAGRIGFTGFIADPAQAMRALDVVVHASTSPEPFGMVIVEGMACGKAVIVSNSGGARELFEEGVDGLGHSSGDASSLAARIIEMAESGDLRARLGKAGRQRSERCFGRERLAAELTRVYEQAEVLR